MAPVIFRRRVANEATNASLRKNKDDSSMSTSLSSTKTETTVGTDGSDETREDRSLSGFDAIYDDDDEDWRNDFLSPGSAIVKDLEGTQLHQPLSPVASASYEDEDTEGTSSSPACVMHDKHEVESNQRTLDETPKQTIKTFDDISVPMNDPVLKEGSIWSDTSDKDAPKSPPSRHHRHRSMTAVNDSVLKESSIWSDSSTEKDALNSPPRRHHRHRSMTSVTLDETPKQTIQTFDDYSVPLNDKALKEGSIWSDSSTEKDTPKSPPRGHNRHRSMTAVTFLDTTPARSPPMSPSTPAARPPQQHRRSSSLNLQKAPPRSPVSPAAPLSLESLNYTREMRAQRFGPLHFTVGQTFNLIGNHHFRNHHYDMAIHAYQQALKCTEGGDSDHIAAAYGNIGTVCWSTGDLKMSVYCLEQALKLRRESERANGEDPEKSLSVASSYHQLGLARSLKQEYGKALVALRHALKIQETVLGNKSIEVARSLDAIGKVHLYQGDADEALNCHQTAYAIWFESSGGEHSPALTASLMNIAAAHMARKDYEQATSMYVAVRNAQVVEMQKAAKDGNPDLLRLSEEAGETSQVLLDLFIKMDSLDSAQVAVEETLRLYQQAKLSEDHPKMQALKASAKELQKAALYASGLRI